MTWPFTSIIAAILIGATEILGGLAKLSIGDINSYGQIVDSVIITPFDILFNRIPLVDINFFNLTGVSGTTLQFRQAVAGWYYTMRLIASMVLLVILIYIGIRMALTSIATEKAIYKKMLVDWVTSLALLFLLHYIILFVFSVNDTLVNAMETIANNTTSTDSAFVANGKEVLSRTHNSYNEMMTSVQSLMFTPNIIIRLVAIILYGFIIFYTISFLIAYIKRMFTIGFLIIIAPLITITYSIDKIGDGKAQALNTWLKEFVYNILLQPFQCIVYLVFSKLAFDAILSGYIINFDESFVGIGIFAVLSLHFVKEAEKIVKKIFGFDKASTAGDLAIGAALTAGAIFKGKDIAKKYGGGVMKGKNKLASAMKNHFKDKRTERANKKYEKAVEREAKKIDRKNGVKNDSANDSANNSSSKKTKKKFTASSEAMKQARQNVDANRQKKKIRTDKVKSTAEKTLKLPKVKAIHEAYKKSSTGKVLSGLWQYTKDNRKSIYSAGLGLFGAGMGLASSEFGDISKAVAGYGMGKGFVEGIYENSVTGVKEELGGLVQLIANLTGNSDVASILSTAQLASMNDIKKSIKEALKELNSSLVSHGIKNPNIAIGEFNNLAMDKDTAGTLNEAWISQKLTESGFQGTDKEKSEVIKKFKDYGTLVAQQSVGTIIENAAAIDIDREFLADKIGNVTPETGYLSVKETSEIVTQELSENTNNVNISNLEETNERIKKLNDALESFKASNDASKDEILNAIRANNHNIHTREDVINSINQKIETLKQSARQQENSGEG